MHVVIPQRYSGPPTSGNGGWVSGILAMHTPLPTVASAVTARLQQPPPLERELVLDEGRTPGEATTLLDGDTVVATAVAAPPLREEVPDPVSTAVAREAESRGVRAQDHPFPTCYGCGPANPDGLQIRSGAVDPAGADSRYAATWTPRDASLPEVWAALDCPGGKAAGFPSPPMVLGTMTAQLFTPPVVGEEHVVVSWPRGADGRKRYAGSALFTADGQLLARAEQTWITIGRERAEG
ncbi:hypothetical protein BCF74_12717 [Knoellia remsis]|uniref:Thioesterase superfamily protein n=1 Tax=Knoellia remsis TaxID=407159 RepID=A0A2T0U6E6_9MICO|nr:hypothetical protein BCF74_12717 [Knoellia remsis]